MARRFGSAMISNTDSTPLIYPYWYIPVKEYNERPYETLPQVLDVFFVFVAEQLQDVAVRH